MKVLWRFLGQKPDLRGLEKLPLAPGVADGPRPDDRRGFYERVVAHEAPGAPEADGPYRRLARAVRGYRIFPNRLVTGVLARDPVEAGDTFGICYHFLPGIDLFFTGRVTDSFDGPGPSGVWRAGFTFQTVQGHPVLGEETFFVEKDAASGGVRVGLSNWSRAGTWLTWLARPYLRWTQDRASYAALDELARVAAHAPASGGR